MPTVPISISLPSDTLERLDAVASDGRVTRSWLATTILQGWLDRHYAMVSAGAAPVEAANAGIAASLDARL